MRDQIDILMITYNRPEYTALSLSRLLRSCDESMRVWVWHNGTHEPTLEVVRRHQDHPRLYRFHHSEENRKLNEPTNWLWKNAEGAYLSKVDDDCLMPDGWAQTLRQAHEDEPRFGILGCWRFFDEDFVPELANKKIKTFSGGHQIMQNCWIEGSGYLMKQQCVQQMGLLKPGQTFTGYGIDLAQQGWVHGWYHPFLFQEHMDDPRSEHSLLKTDADIEHYLPLSAQMRGIATLAAWQERLKASSRELQSASINPRDYRGWRRRVRRLCQRLTSSIDS